MFRSSIRCFRSSISLLWRVQSYLQSSDGGAASESERTWTNWWRRLVLFWSWLCRGGYFIEWEDNPEHPECLQSEASSPLRLLFVEYLHHFSVSVTATFTWKGIHSDISSTSWRRHKAARCHPGQNELIFPWNGKMSQCLICSLCSVGRKIWVYDIFKPLRSVFIHVLHNFSTFFNCYFVFVAVCVR